MTTMTRERPVSDLDPMHEPLVLDLVAWIAVEPRPYAEVMDGWRTSCPRLPVWETAVDRGLVTRRPGSMVEVTEAGRRALRTAGRR